MVKALAKDPGDRYGSCGELIADARAVLAHPIVPPRLLRRRHAILAAGVLVLCDRGRDRLGLARRRLRRAAGTGSAFG